MPVDTRGFDQGHVGKRMRVELSGGELLDIRLHEMTVCAKPEPCCGITYSLLSSNRPGAKRDKGGVYWTGFGDIEKFQVLGD
jgi:hypothetical protein